MDTVAAVDAFVLIDQAEAILVVGDGICWAGLLTGTLSVDNGFEGAGLCAETAGLTLLRIDLHPGFARMDSAEAAG